MGLEVETDAKEVMRGLQVGKGCRGNSNCREVSRSSKQPAAMEKFPQVICHEIVVHAPIEYVYAIQSIPCCSHGFWSPSGRTHGTPGFQKADDRSGTGPLIM